MMAYDGVEAQFQLFLTLTYKNEWSASSQSRCTPLHLTKLEDTRIPVSIWATEPPWKLHIKGMPARCQTAIAW